MKARFFLLALFLVSLMACYYDKEEILYPGNTACDTTNVRYSIQIQGIISQNCLPCHSAVTASGGIALETYDQVKTMVQNGRVPAAINHQQGSSPMPKSAPKLSDCKIKTIEIWQQQGCPQ